MLPGSEFEKKEYSITFSFAILFDADNDLNGKVQSINSIFSVLPGKPGKTQLSHGGIVRCQDTLIGCYIFSGDNKCGALEDILVPLMREGNEDIFDDARQYFQNYCPPKKRNDYKKPVIGITGQFQKPGYSNNVIIQTSRYITEPKIAGNKKCREIIEFFKKLI